MTKKNVNVKGEDELLKSQDKYVLKLYVTGATPNSVRAISNITSICKEYLDGKQKLEIVDVYLDKDIAAREQIVALPMLVKEYPLPRRRLIGDLSNTSKVLEALNIKH